MIMHNYAIVLNNMQAKVFSLPEIGGLHFPCRVYGRKHLTYLRDLRMGIMICAAVFKFDMGELERYH